LDKESSELLFKAKVKWIQGHSSMYIY